MSGGDIRCSAVIVAAGSAQRMQGIDKLLAPLDGVPVLRRTVEALASAPEITELIVVTRADRLEAVQALCEGLSKPVSVVPGGKTRAESVLCGLSAAAMPYAAIHDGARPLVTNEVIAQAVSAAVSCGAAAPAVPVHDTIKRAESGLVLETPDRSTLFAVQTPQVFRTEEIRSVLRWGHRAGAAAHGRLLRHGSGRKAGAPDARRCRKFEDHNTGRSAHRRGDLEGENDMRIGHGYDVHRLVPGRKLILGGVEIPFERGLDGHSDADVLTHALMDALLGAASLGDIGLLFPDNDPQYKGISSLLLLEEVVRRVHAAGFAVGNADITVLCQRPKLRPHIPAMQERLRALLGTEAVNVKATTEEGLGFTGSGEGIACHAVCLLEERA